MSIYARLFNVIRLPEPQILARNFHAIGARQPGALAPHGHVTTTIPVASGTPAIGAIFTQAVRTVIRNHFPRPSENKRIKVHGWKKRLSTPEGRRILMARILKGRYVISH